MRATVLDALAHEFKTPLATILTAAGGLRHAGPLAGPQAELAEMIESEAERLGELSSRLLRLARIDRDDVRPRLGSFDVEAEAVDGRKFVQLTGRVGAVALEPALCVRNAA